MPSPQHHVKHNLRGPQLCARTATTSAWPSPSCSNWNYEHAASKFLCALRLQARGPRLSLQLRTHATARGLQHLRTFVALKLMRAFIDYYKRIPCNYARAHTSSWSNTVRFGWQMREMSKGNAVKNWYGGNFPVSSTMICKVHKWNNSTWHELTSFWFHSDLAIAQFEPALASQFTTYFV